MKKMTALFVLFFLLTAASPQVTHEGRSDLKPLQRSAFVLGRGIVNALASPLEISRTLSVERQWHPKAWPLSYIPRTLYNFCQRLSSAAYDIAFFPFIVPFTDDIRPLTRTFDLPDYPWQLEVGEE